MPPKKTPDKKSEAEEEPAGYDVDNLSQDQLKQYAHLLQGEIEDMRRHCNFYQKMEDELVELLRISEEDQRHNESCVLSKDVELEKLKLNFLKHLREKRQWPKYMEHTTTIRQNKQASITDNQLREENNRHLEETEQLKQILLEKDRKLEALRVKIEMARRETQEKNEKQLKDMDEHQRSLLDQSIKKFDAMMEEAEFDFQQAKVVMECEAREGKFIGERAFNNACEAFKEKLHDYYKEVTKQDLDVVRQLKREIKKVEDSIESSKLLLQEAEQENKQLKEAVQIKLPKRGFKMATKFDAGPLKMAEALKVHKKIERLALVNQNLEEQIKSVMDQAHNLRRQFTLALKKVRESAEMKAAILERKLEFILREQRSDSASNPTEESESS